MRIAITGGTGFLGRYIVKHLCRAGHECRVWCRESSDRSGLFDDDANIDWIDGQLGDSAAAFRLVESCDAVVHAALDRREVGYQGTEGDVIEFAATNILGSLRLIEEARIANVPRFVYVSSCAVHDVICDDRALDEAHPLWPASHYGAHKAAIEKFVHSFGLGAGYGICAIRPPRIYGMAHPPENSKWYSLVQSVVRGKTVQCQSGGKQVHAADVAKGIELLLQADLAKVNGQVYTCYDRYISDFDVATIAKQISGSNAQIQGQAGQPKHEIVSDKIKALGLEFGGTALLRDTISELVAAIQKS